MIKQFLVKAQVARDEVFARATSFESEHKSSTVVVEADVDARFGQVLSEKEDLRIELAKWNERSFATEKISRAE